MGKSKTENAARPVSARTIAVMGLLTAIGLLVPYVTAHAFGVKGTVLLPMHFPILLMGMLCGPYWGAVGGLVVPLLSSLLTGMPAFYPTLPIMMCELFVYGVVTGILYNKKKMNVYLALLLAMAAGRIVHGAVWAVFYAAGGQTVTFVSAFAFVLEGIPGTILQLLLIPVVVLAARRYGWCVLTGTPGELPAETSPDALTEMREDLPEAVAKAKALISSDKASFVVIKDGEIVYHDKGNGVRPIMKLLDTDSALLQDAVVVDKIIGRAAAMLLVLGNISAVYANLMSRAAEDYLAQKHLGFHYERCIQVLSNRTGDGLCPLERAVADIDDERQAYEKLRETIAQLQKKAAC